MLKVCPQPLALVKDGVAFKTGGSGISAHSLFLLPGHCELSGCAAQLTDSYYVCLTTASKSRESAHCGLKLSAKIPISPFLGQFPQVFYHSHRNLTNRFKDPAVCFNDSSLIFAPLNVIDLC